MAKLAADGCIALVGCLLFKYMRCTAILSWVQIAITHVAETILVPLVTVWGPDTGQPYHVDTSQLTESPPRQPNMLPPLYQ